LQYSRAENPPKIIAITSAVPVEGKSSTSLNLAISMATSGMKTLLIEGDMRRPRVLEYLGITSNPKGLSEILTGKLQGDIASRVNKAAFVFAHKDLMVIASGAIPPNPAELLGSETFAQLVEYTKEKYDFVVIDCPPTLLVADAAIIARHTDGAVIITRVTKTKIHQFMGARENLTNVGVHVIGVVMNMVPNSRTNEYGRKYGYGYVGYRSYRASANEPGYDPVRSYAPKEVAAQIERDSRK